MREPTPDIKMEVALIRAIRILTEIANSSSNLEIRIRTKAKPITIKAMFGYYYVDIVFS